MLSGKKTIIIQVNIVVPAHEENDNFCPHTGLDPDRCPRGMGH